MTLSKLRKILGRIGRLRNRPNNISSKELKNIAESLGRKRRTGGKHDIYNSELEGTRSLSIPRHSGSLPKGTALSILGDLEREAYIWMEQLSGTGGNDRGE